MHPPRLRLLTQMGWDGLSNVAHVNNLAPGWSGSHSSMGITSPGLRGTGQALGTVGGTGVRDLNFTLTGSSFGGNWNTFNVLFDYENQGLTDSIVVECYCSGSSPLQVRIDNNGFFYVRNTAPTTVLDWVSTKKTVALTVYKIEFLAYVKGSTQGFFQLWIDGVLVLAASAVNLGADSLVDLTLTKVRWHDDIILDNFALYVGNGGFSSADVLSDSSGNPQILQQTVAGQGLYHDGTSTPAGASTSNYTVVDETISNESNVTDYVTLPADTTSRESYTITAIASTVTRVLGVAAYYLSKTDTAAQAKPDAFIRLNPETGVAFNDSFAEPMASTYSSVSNMTSGQYFNALWRKNPATGKEFTRLEVNASEFGWRRTTSTGGLTYVGHVWAESLCYVSPPTVVSGGTRQLSLLTHKTHRLAKLWKLEPRWGLPYFFTDHNAPLVFGQNTYVPSGAWSATAARRELGLKDADVDFSGVITSGAITASDLRAGRYRQAHVTELLVDWRYPWAGAIVTRVWTVEDIQFDGEKWIATMSGLQARLGNTLGDVLAPRCRFNLFDNDLPIPGVSPDPERGCKLDAMRMYRTFDVTGTITDRRIFVITVNGSPALPAGWQNDGLLIFSKGANANIVGEIRDFTTGTITLHLPLPFDVVSATSGLIWPGCNKLHGVGTALGDCIDKHNNGVNYGGHDLQPGTDEAMRGGEL